MNSPSTSSATLSIHSDEDFVSCPPPPADDDDTRMSLVPYNSEHSDDGDSNYRPPEEYLDPVDEGSLSPSMRAASNSDQRILKAVLSEGFELYYEISCSRRSLIRANYYGKYENYDYSPKILNYRSEYSCHALRSKGRSLAGVTSPIMEAIRAKLPNNVKILLDAGANPNGLPFFIFDDYAALFLRFRPSIQPLKLGKRDRATRSEYLELMDLPQISSLTREEVEDRFWEGMAPFWCEENFTDACFWPHGDTLHALVEAAKSGSIEIFNMLLVSGADATSWKKPQFYVPSPASESALSISSPLHAAIANSKLPMLWHLLELGFDPNTMALSNPTRCVTPLMATIISSNKFEREAFDILCSRPNISLELRTPVYEVHVLHFAVAKLDLEMLQHVATRIPLQNAGTTALGHTLLHIACMPAYSLKIQRHASIIRKSIHETRDTRSFNDYNSLGAVSDRILPLEAGLEQQSLVVRYLWDNGIKDVDERDVHGNTALHYLAGCRTLNDPLLDWWLEDDSVRDVWGWSENAHGATPWMLKLAGSRVEKGPGGCSFAQDNDCNWLADRAEKKEAVWDSLLQKVR